MALGMIFGRLWDRKTLLTTFLILGTIKLRMPWFGSSFSDIFVGDFWPITGFETIRRLGRVLVLFLLGRDRVYTPPTYLLLTLGRKPSNALICRSLSSSIRSGGGINVAQGRLYDVGLCLELPNLGNIITMGCLIL